MDMWTTSSQVTIFFSFYSLFSFIIECKGISIIDFLIDTFASKVAAQNDQFADSSIGNVTGSNAVNVFLGIGIAWTLAAFVHAYRGTKFYVNPGSLVYSVTLFSICAFLCCMVLMVRRRLGGELGGRMLYKVSTVILFVMFWLFYVLMSSLEAYHIIPGF